jgi:hypothetical protein
MAQANACLSASHNRRNSRAHSYDRAKAMQWLSDRCCCPYGDFPDFADETPAGRAAVIEMLRKVCTSMRAAGLRGAWHYNLPLRGALARILECEEAELAAIREKLAAQRGTKGLPANSPGRSPRRAA